MAISCWLETIFDGLIDGTQAATARTAFTVKSAHLILLVAFCC